MYLRTTKRRNADGSEVRYFQLAENVWDAAKGCSVAKVIYSFGRGDDVDAEKMRRLAGSILRVFGDEKDLAAADDVSVRDAWPYGGVYVLQQFWKELGIDTLIEGLLAPLRVKAPFERALFAMVANRALAPYSKLYCCEQWLRDEVLLPDGSEIELQHLYRAMDFFEDHKAQIEKSLYFTMADLMNADVDLIFYDTTSLHFEVDQEDALETEDEVKGDPEDDVDAEAATVGQSDLGLRKRGHSKNGRTDAPQIVIGLAVTRDGLPVRSWVFPGNTADVSTVEKVKEDLRGWKLGRCLFVGDAGMNSEENRQRLGLGNGKYILASKMRSGDEVTKIVLARAGRYKEVKDNLRVKEVVVGDGERRQRYVVCHNPHEETRQSAHREKLLTQLEAELLALKDKTMQGHSTRVCELLTSRRFKRYLRKVGTGGLAIDRAAVEEASRYDGKWVVTSNDDTLSAEDMALGYKQLMRVEECWRTLKSGLRMRPVYHFRPRRIRAHVGISMLALLLERIVEIRVKDTWRNVRATLQTIKIVEYDRAGARIRQTSNVREDAAALLRKLKVPMPPKVHAVAQIAPVEGASA